MLMTTECSYQEATGMEIQHWPSPELACKAPFILLMSVPIKPLVSYSGGKDETDLDTNGTN
jgi:hypothetical protein